MLPKVNSYEKTINKKKLLNLFLCSNFNCQHIFQKNFDKADLNNHYKYPRVKTKPTRDDHKYLNDRIDFVKSNTKIYNLKSILEIGPGDEFFLKKFKKLEKFFYEINPSTRKKLSLLYSYYNFKKKSKRKFDIICASHLLEHIDSPKNFLRNIKKKLSLDKNEINRKAKKIPGTQSSNGVGGVFFLEVPDFSYLNETDNIDGYIFEHLHYFNLRSILKLLDLSGMELIAIRRYLNKKNRTCINYVLQVLAKVRNGKEYNISKIWSLKNMIIKKYFQKNINKKILFWGIGTTFFKFIENFKCQTYKNIYYADIRDYGKNIFGFSIFEPSHFADHIFDILIVCTAEHAQVKLTLKKFNIKCKVVKYIN
jgi:hypothetical protein